MLWMLGVVAMLVDVVSRFADPSRNAIIPAKNIERITTTTPATTTIPPDVPAMPTSPPMIEKDPIKNKAPTPPPPSIRTSNPVIANRNVHQAGRKFLRGKPVTQHEVKLQEPDQGIEHTQSERSQYIPLDTNDHLPIIPMQNHPQILPEDPPYAPSSAQTFPEVYRHQGQLPIADDKAAIQSGRSLMLPNYLMNRGAPGNHLENGEDHKFPPVIDNDEYVYNEELMAVNTETPKTQRVPKVKPSPAEEDFIDPMYIPENDLDKDEDIS